MIQRRTIVFTVIGIITMIISGIGPLHLSGISDANLITFAQPAPNSKDTAEQKVTFLTDDKVLIVGTYYSPSSSNKNTSTDAIILLHMLGRDRNDWNPFASTLSNSTNGYAVLSIDLRGHGESVNQNGKAAKQFLVTQKGINPNNIAIVGASIGANVALNYAASDPSIKAVVLLSPGLNYKGVITSDSIRKYVNPIYMATAGKDPVAGSDPQTLCNEINCGNKLNLYQDSSSHGTDMFLDKSLNPPLDNLIVLWLDATFGKSLQSTS